MHIPMEACTAAQVWDPVTQKVFDLPPNLARREYLDTGFRRYGWNIRSIRRRANL